MRYLRDEAYMPSDRQPPPRLPHEVPMSSIALRPTSLVPPVFFALAMASCGPSTPAGTSVELSFEARVGDAAFACGQTYDGVGATSTSLTAYDLRLYVHDVRLVTSSGHEVPLTLDDDDFQNGSVALLDFETGGTACEAGNAPTHTTLTGTVAEAGPYTALRLRIGVPESRNHLDSGGQPSPLNLTSMYWGWQAGYKFLRFEAGTTGVPSGIVFHLGATNCTGDATMGTRTCANGNRPDLEIPLPAGFTPGTHTFVLDVASWLADLDLDHDMGGDPGCMSGTSDPDCAAWFGTVGLPSATTQTIFTVEAR
jgi:uncharacterized repeat protein (TIGR04052 family)